MNSDFDLKPVYSVRILSTPNYAAMINHFKSINKKVNINFKLSRKDLVMRRDATKKVYINFQ